MNDFDPEEEAVLESARRALTPSAVVTQRMRAALLAKLAVPGAAAAAAGAATSVTAAGTSAHLIEGVTESVLASGAGSLATGAAVATGGAGALATGAKVAASGAGILATGTKLAVSATVLKAAAGVTTAAMLATAGYYWAPRQAAPPTAAPAPHAAPASAPGKRNAPGQQARGVVTARQAESARARSPELPEIAGSEAAPEIGVAPAAPNAGSQQQLQGELDVLKRVRQALQTGDARYALSLLAELDAKHPVSPLLQEREVARVLALCGAGRVTAARETAQRLLGPNPNSLYAERIQASCAATSAETRATANSTASGPTKQNDDTAKSTKVAPPVARFDDSGN